LGQTIRLAVFVSGSGTNLEAIINAIKEKKLNAKIVAVFGSKESIPAMDIAKENLVPTFPPLLDRSKITVLNERKVDLIVLAGYLKKISPMIISEYKNKIINIHPSLLPKFGGKGMYGIDVHKAVIKAKETVSGATVHYVNEKYDDGQIIIQESIEILPNDTHGTLQRKVLEIEHRILVEAIREMIDGKE